MNMKLFIPLLLLFALCEPVFAAQTTVHKYIGTNGPTRLQRGKSIIQEFEFYWLRGGQFTEINYDTELATCPDCGFVKGNNVYMYAEGGDWPAPLGYQFPGPMTTRVPTDVGTQPAQYRFRAEASSNCENGNLSELIHPTEGNPTCFDFVEPAEGVTLHAGTRVQNEAGHLIFTGQVDNLPSGVTLELSYPGHYREMFTQAGTGRKYIYASFEQTWATFTASSDATLGPATVRVHFVVTSVGGVSAGSPYSYIDLNINVVAPEAVTRGTPASVPPIPGLRRAENTLRAGALRWCNPDGPFKTYAPFNGPAENEPHRSEWYYDGAYIYHSLAYYFNDPKWRTCAENISRQYAAYQYVGNGLNLYRTYTDGFLKQFYSSGDWRYVATTRRTENWAALKSLKDTNLREISLTLENLSNISKLNGTVHPKLAQMATIAIGLVTTLHVEQSGLLHQTWMDGLLGRALIRYWEVTKDPEAAWALKAIADFYIDNEMWNSTTREMVYNVYEYGISCPYNCRTIDSGTGETTGHWNGDQAGLNAPIFAWVWWYTGEDIYRQIADEMFESAPMFIDYSLDAANDCIITPYPHDLAENEEIRTALSFHPTTHDNDYDQPYPIIYASMPLFVKLGDIGSCNVPPGGGAFKVSRTSGGAVYDLAGAEVSGRAPLVIYLRGGIDYFEGPATGQNASWNYSTSEKGKTFNQNFRGFFDFVKYRTRAYSKEVF
jgi:hypothetical protein